MMTRWLAWLAISLIAASSAAAQVSEKHPGDRSGIAVAGGFGGPFAGLGAHVAYYARLGEGTFVTPFLGYGVVGTDVHGFYLGPSAGAMLMLGRENHWVLSSSYGLLGVVRRLERETPSVNLGTLLIGDTSTEIYGATLEGGYEWMLSDGGLFRLTLGAQWIPSPRSDTHFFPIFGIAGGWKS